MAATTLGGLVALLIVVLRPSVHAHLTWFTPAVYVSTFVLLGVVAAISATETWVEADRRPLSLAAASLAIGILWLVNVPTVNHNQISSALFTLAHTGGPVLLLLAAVGAKSVPLSRPGRAIRLRLAYSVATGVGLVAVTVAVAPSLPKIANGSTLTTFGTVITTGAIVPLGITLIWAAVTKRADRDGPVIGAVILLTFESLAQLGTHSRFSAAWYMLSFLRSASFVLITFGSLRLYAFSAQGERHRAKDLELLHEATRRIGSSLNPKAVAQELGATAQTLLADRTGIRPAVRVLKVDGSVVSVMTDLRSGVPVPGPIAGADDHEVASDVIDSSRLGLYPGLAQAIERGEPTVMTTPVPVLVVPIGSPQANFGAIEISHTVAGHKWQGADTVALLQGLANLAALALANAETFDELQAAEAHNRAVLLAINDAFISLTLDGAVVGWNDHATDLLGWSVDAVLGRDIIATVITPEMREKTRAMLRCLGEVEDSIALRQPRELEVLHADGSTIQVEANMWRVDSADSTRLCVLVRDISARKEAEDRLTRRATHDPLTELPNRALLLDYLTRALSPHNHRRELVGVIFVDLDGFKSINDEHGHDAGDRLLASVAFRLASGLRPEDVVGRLGGDEFLVVCRGLPYPGEIETVADRLRAVFSDPIPLDDLDIAISASIGTAVAMPGSITARELIRQADKSMYREKDSHGPPSVPSAV